MRWIREWVMDNFQSNVVGQVRCYRCGKLLQKEQMTVDRIVPGRRTGMYERDNVRPACHLCNEQHGGDAKFPAPDARDAAIKAVLISLKRPRPEGMDTHRYAESVANDVFGSKAKP